ncbi:MAG: DUF4421 family protein [Muribaculaceae bacterium]|nr:DUF4421 family protein [Muribaculaceae bacterium]
MRILALLLAFFASVTALADAMPAEVDTVAEASVALTDTMPKQRNRLERLGDEVKQRIADKLNEPYDTVRDNRYWWRAMKHGKVNFNDSTMRYPKFVMFCYKLYKWGDKAFNSYDSAYVVSTGKNWKLTLKNRNWMDDFTGGDGVDNARFISGAASNIGLYLSFMAVSVGYSLDIDRIFGAKGTSEMIEFSFTCARFNVEARKTTNTGRMSTRYKLNSGSWQRGSKLDAMRRETMGVSAAYFFNSYKYARAAAYCFSKYQRRSAGSALAGFSIINYDFRLDTAQLTQEQIELYNEVGVAHVRYTDYCLKGGYAYNWVINRKLLFNVTAMAGGGVKHVHTTQFHHSHNIGALNLSGSLALTYNHKRFFASLQTAANTSLYISGDYHFGYTISDLTAVLGIRF